MEDAIKVLVAGRSFSYSNGAAVAVIIYDVLMVFPREVTHIWRSKWTPAKILYLLVRYWGAFLILLTFIVYSQRQDSLRFCQSYFVLSTAGGPIVIITLVHIITFMRLYALYDRSKLFLTAVGGLVSAFITVDFVLSGLMARHGWKTTFLAPPSLPLQGCLCDFPPIIYVMLNWGNSLFVSFLLFAMMCIKFHASILRQKHSGLRNISPVFEAFVQGGTVWFFLILAALIVSVSFTNTVDGPLRQAFLPWLLITLSLAGSRLILELREAAERSERRATLIEKISSRPPGL